MVCFFFFQAEDGIRDYKMTGVQTCALPICRIPAASQYPRARSQLIVSTASDPPRKWLGLDPVTRWYAACVTSVRPIQKPFVRVTWCAGFSEGKQLLTPAEQPIIKFPGAIQDRKSTRLNSSHLVI